ncbi:hypothetical protein AAVH_10693 [Aphelenchoides avenae]|nr:hypothetical protein AAVH_10693 [Aphelenchus avenae]
MHRKSVERCEGLVRQVLDANSALMQERNKIAQIDAEKEALCRKLRDTEKRAAEADITAERLSQELDEVKKEAEEQRRLVEDLREQLRAVETTRLGEPPAKPDYADVDIVQNQEEVLAAISSEFKELLQSVQANSSVGGADDSGMASDLSASPVSENISSLNGP